MEKVPFSGIADIIGSAIDTEQNFAKITPVLRNYSTIFYVWFVQ
jgi:hypothetical protein